MLSELVQRDESLLTDTTPIASLTISRCNPSIVRRIASFNVSINAPSGLAITYPSKFLLPKHLISPYIILMLVVPIFQPYSKRCKTHETPQSLIIRLANAFVSTTLHCILSTISYHVGMHLNLHAVVKTQWLY